jgi:hypothetical protein
MKHVTLAVVLTSVLALGLVLTTSGCGSKPAAKSDNAPEAAVQGVQYTCPMHPEVISDKPGKCPKCGMTLVIKK